MSKELIIVIIIALIIWSGLICAMCCNDRENTGLTKNEYVGY